MALTKKVSRQPREPSSVIVAETETTLSSERFVEPTKSQFMNSLGESNSYGIDIVLEVLAFIKIPLDLSPPTETPSK